MSENDDRERADRRKFLKLVGVAGAAASTLPFSRPGSASEQSKAVPHQHETRVVGSGVTGVGYQFFNTLESAFIASAVDVLIPADSIGPGAAALGSRRLYRLADGGQLWQRGPLVSGGSVRPATTTTLRRPATSEEEASAAPTPARDRSSTIRRHEERRGGVLLGKRPS